jgi:hypothetical protein
LCTPSAHMPLDGVAPPRINALRQVDQALFEPGRAGWHPLQVRQRTAADDTTLDLYKLTPSQTGTTKSAPASGGAAPPHEPAQAARLVAQLADARSNTTPARPAAWTSRGMPTEHGQIAIPATINAAAVLSKKQKVRAHVLSTSGPISLGHANAHLPVPTYPSVCSCVRTAISSAPTTVYSRR